MRRDLIFCVFVGSTFNDLKAGRDALQREVFPRLRELYVQQGCRFQVDRPALGRERRTGLDQQTVKIIRVIKIVRRWLIMLWKLAVRLFQEKESLK